VVWELVERVAELAEEVIVAKALIVVAWEVDEVTGRVLLEVVDKSLVAVDVKVTARTLLEEIDKALVVVLDVIASTLLGVVDKALVVVIGGVTVVEVVSEVDRVVETAVVAAVVLVVVEVATKILVIIKHHLG